MRSTSLVLALTFLAAGSEAAESETAALEEERIRAAAFVAAAATESGAMQTRSGLVIRAIQSGRGAYPGPEDEVVVRYTGRLVDGTVIDTTDRRGPARFRLTRLIKCWGEGVTLMREGETAVLTCPTDLAYGDRGVAPTVPPGAALQFDVTLEEIVRAER